MFGSLRRFRLLVNIRCKPNIACRSVGYSVSSSEDGDNGADPSAGSAVKTRTRLVADQTSLGSDMHGQYQPPDTTAADYVPYAVIKMRERMRAKYGLETQSDAAIGLEHTNSGMKAIRGKFGNDYFDAAPTERRTKSYSMTETNAVIDDTVDSVKQPNRQELLQKYTFLKKQKVTDKVMDMTFGAIRLDSMNQPLYHGDRDRVDVHNENLDVEPEDDFTVTHLSSSSPIDRGQTLPESMENDSRQQSESYSDIDTESRDYRTAEPYQNSGRQTFIEHKSAIDEHTHNVGRKHKARFGRRGMLETSCPTQLSAAAASDPSDRIKVNNDSFIDEQYFSTNDLSTPAISTPEESQNTSQSSGTNYIDEQYFGTSGLSTPDGSIPEESQRTLQEASNNFIDDQYFELNTVSSDQQEPAMTDSSTSGSIFGQYVNSIESVDTKPPQKYEGEIELIPPKITHSAAPQQDKEHIMSSKHNSTRSRPGKHSTVLPPRESFSEDNLFDTQYFSKELSDDVQTSHSVTSRSDRPVKVTKPAAVDSSTTHSTVDNVSTRGDYFGTMTKQEQRVRNQPVPDLENPRTAFDLAMKIRLEKKGKLSGDGKEAEMTTPSKMKWTGKVDSKGFRILQDQVLNLEYLSEDVIVKILRDSVIYEDEEIIAIDKPYGLPSHGGPGVHHSMDRYKQPLADSLSHSQKVDTLHLVHRLDKETTGVFLFAKNEKAAWRLHQMFKKREVVKKYWVITKGVPNPTEGVIDIPMMEAEVQGKYRMALRPDYSSETKILMKSAHKVHKFNAVTNYRVLDSYQSAALVECQPESGVKHQIRCHLAFGLNTPILGDHKYSHYSKIAPQKLYPDILQRLGVRQTKVRHVPMHLHAVNLILPEFRDGRNVFISARLPRHFVQNMKWLKLKLPK